MCHERTIDVGLAELAIDGFDRATLEPVLIYCAELRCEADAATCPGCKRRTEAHGIHSPRRLHRPAQGRSSSATVPFVSWARAKRTLHDACSRRAGEDLVGRELLVLGAARSAQAAPRHPPLGPAWHSAFAGEGETPAVLLMEPQLRRQRRHGGARHGQLRPRRFAPHRAARRLAEREGAHRRFGRQLHHRRRGGLPDPRCGDQRLQLAGRDHRAPARFEEARADPHRGRGGDAPPHRPRRALRRAVRARAQRFGDLRGRQRRRADHDSGKFSFRFAKLGAGGADPRLRVDAWK